MIKEQFMKNKLLIAGIVVFVIALGIISVYGYTQYGPKQITISSLDASTGMLETKTITASSADTVEQVLRKNGISFDSINYKCSEDLNAKIRNISQIHIEKKATSQSKSTIEKSGNQASATQKTSNSQNTSSGTNVSSSYSEADGISKTPSSTAVQPLNIAPILTASQAPENDVSSEAPKDNATSMSVSPDVSQKEQEKSEPAIVHPIVEITSTTTDTSQDLLDKKANDYKTEDTNNSEAEKSSASSNNIEVEKTSLSSNNSDVEKNNSSSNNLEVEIKKLPSDNNTEVNNNDTNSDKKDAKPNAEQSVKTETIEMDIPYGTKRVNSDQVKTGEEIVTTRGVNGLKKVTSEVTYANNEIVSRKTTSEVIITEPVTEVISVGTGTETTLQPAPDSSSGSEKVEEDSNNKQEPESTDKPKENQKVEENSNDIQEPEPTDKPEENQNEDNPLDSYSEYALNVNMSNGGSYGNATQSTSSINMDLVRAVVAQEGGTSYEGALGVISCIMNRSDSGAWGGTDVESIIKAPGQFAAFESGAYEKYLGQSLPEVEAAISDCMDFGLRTHPYQSFRSYQTDGSVTNIGGNWYF